MSDLCLFLDWEAVNGRGTWSAFAFTIMDPRCAVYEKLEGYCIRPHSDYDESRLSFWGRHHEAAAYISRRAVGRKEPVEQERDLCMGLAAWSRKYPTLRIVSDNPSFDVALTNRILQSHGFPTMNDMWGQIPLCLTTASNALLVRVHTRPRHTPMSDIFDQHRLLVALIVQRPKLLTWG